MSKSIFESKGFKKAMSMTYGFGASVVIVGALFKILHWPGADLMLIIGLLTEAGIFAISAFEPLHKEYDWSLVYPELAGIDPLDTKKSQGTVSQQLDKMLEEAKVGPELISSLGTGLKSLSSNVAEMASLSNASVATNEYTQNLQKATKSIGEVGEVTESFSKSMSSLSGGINSLAENLVSGGEEAGQFKSNISSLNKNISNLNNIYGNMLSAMTGNQASR
jgi:gliding motility-associated protein GldL